MSCFVIVNMNLQPRHLDRYVDIIRSDLLNDGNTIAGKRSHGSISICRTTKGGKSNESEKAKKIIIIIIRARKKNKKRKEKHPRLIIGAINSDR